MSGNKLSSSSSSSSCSAVSLGVVFVSFSSPLSSWIVSSSSVSVSYGTEKKKRLEIAPEKDGERENV